MNRCVLIPKPGVVRLEERPMPVPARGEALLKVLYGGICGSDLGTYRGTLAYVSYPRVPGHELAAEIVDVPASNAFSLKPGMLVTVNPYFNCGTCYPCRNGRVNCCVSNQTMGVQREGGFSNYLTMPMERIYPVENLGARETALIEPFCISYHGIKRAGIKPGEKVLIVGAGTIGVLAMLAARHFGAEAYIADIAPGKLEHAARLGAAGTFLNTSPEALAEWAADTTGGDSFGVTVEAVGMAGTFRNAIDSAAFSGRVVVIGVSKETLDFDFTVIQKKELTVFGSRNATRSDFTDVMEIMKSLPLSSDMVVTDVYKVEQAAEAFAEFSAKAGEKLKVLLDFS